MATVKNAVDVALQATSPRVVAGSGSTNYTWIMYATSSAGAGITSNPVGMSYIGIAANKTTATPSTTPSDYVWSLILGPTGATGATGATGSGNAGDSARRAYVVNTSSTVPGAVTPGVGDVVPTSSAGTWSFTATSTLSAGQYMYQVDGTYVAGGNTSWGNPYLSNLKVGTLSALTANLGTVNAGNITGTAGMQVTGQVLLTGLNLDATYGFYSGLTVNQSGSGNGITATVTTSFNAVLGRSTGAGGGNGVAGTAVGPGYGVECQNASNVALDVSGKMTISNSTVVTNLNAQYHNGLTSAQFVQYSSTGTMNINGLSTGAQAATFNAANKPGASPATNVWMVFTLNGTVYYLPVWQ